MTDTSNRSETRSESVGGRVDDVRRGLVETGLLWSALAAPWVLLISFLRVPRFGWHPVYFIYVTVVGGLLIGSIFRKRWPYHVSACVLLGGFLATGTGGLLVFGLPGGGDLLPKNWSTLSESLW